MTQFNEHIPLELMQSDNLSICNGPRPVYDDLLLIYDGLKEIYGGPVHYIRRSEARLR